jgi:hypothetical protein
MRLIDRRPAVPLKLKGLGADPDTKGGGRGRNLGTLGHPVACTAGSNVLGKTPIMKERHLSLIRVFRAMFRGKLIQ